MTGIEIEIPQDLVGAIPESSVDASEHGLWG
jgi:dUTPase